MRKTPPPEKAKLIATIPRSVKLRLEHEALVRKHAKRPGIDHSGPYTVADLLTEILSDALPALPPEVEKRAAKE